MSYDFADSFFATPSFKPDEALVSLKRQLREVGPLVERSHRYELNGKGVVEVSADDDAINCRLAKRPASAPDWESHSLKTSAEVRKFVDEVKKRLARWTEDER